MSIDILLISCFMYDPLIEGEILLATDQKKFKFSSYHLLVKGEGKTLQEITTDSVGRFSIKATFPVQGEYDLYLSGFGAPIKAEDRYNRPTTKGLYLGSFTAGSKMRIKLPKEYALQNGKEICPKCHRKDRTYPIYYGEGQTSVLIISKKDTTYSRISNRRYQGGSCIVSSFNPQWYCDREKLEF